jgi:adenosylhomocysteine nucleosidase
MATVEENGIRGPIVAITADHREVDGLLRYAQSVKVLDWPLAFAREAIIDDIPWIIVAHGPGPKLAEEAIRCVLSKVVPEVILSVGFCGGLDPDLRTGDIFVATEVRVPSKNRAYRAGAPKSPGPHGAGPLISMDRVAATVAEKEKLRSTGAAAIDMEAASVAAAAEERGAPFYCVRVVSDNAFEPMPLDFNRYRDRKGRFSIPRIAGAAAFRPTVIPALLRLEINCRQASAALGDFLVSCHF